MGSGASQPLPRPPVPEGKTRVCVAGFKVSHNTGLAQQVAAEIAKTHPETYESWTYFAWPGTFRAFMNGTVKKELSPEQQEKFGPQTSSPFCWLELPDGTRDCKGGGDRLREWALDTFPESDPKNANIRALSARGPTIGDSWVDETPGTAARE